MRISLGVPALTTNPRARCGLLPHREEIMRILRWVQRIHMRARRERSRGNALGQNRVESLLESSEAIFIANNLRALFAKGRAQTTIAQQSLQSLYQRW